MIICKACELKQEPITPKCRRCGKLLIPQGPLPVQGFRQEKAFTDALPFIVVTADMKPVVPLAKLERDAIENALRQYEPMKAAELLGIGKTTIYRYIRDHQLVPLRHGKA